MEKAKKITILMLHLQHGGIERQTILFANELCKKYNVEIISTYSMKKEPAYNVDNRIKIKYLIDDAPNRNEFKEAIKKINIFKIMKEGLKAFKILKLKKKLMEEQIKKLDSDYVLSTRIEYAEMLSKYAQSGVITITQEHLHDDSTKYISRVKKAFSNLDFLIVLGPGSYENYSKWLIDNKKIKILEIPNILDNIPDEKSKLNGFTLVSTGRMHPVKGFDDLLKVFKIVHDNISSARLNLIGDGDEYEKIKSMACKIGVSEYINMPGMVSIENVKKYMLESDIYVMTSLTECFPMVLLEASSCGLPLIAFDVPVGPKAIIQDGYNGYLIQERDIEQMAKKIIELLKNRNKMDEMSKCAVDNARQYLAENVMKKWYNIFDK